MPNHAAWNDCHVRKSESCEATADGATMRLLSLSKAACRVGGFAAAAKVRERSPRMVLATTGAVDLALTALDTAPGLSMAAKSLQSSLAITSERGNVAAVAEEGAEGGVDTATRVSTRDAEGEHVEAAEEHAKEAEHAEVVQELVEPEADAIGDEEEPETNSRDEVVQVPWETTPESKNLKRGSPAAAAEAARFPLACAKR